MYKVIVADDEDRIRNGITKLIRYFDIGFTVCATAKNGLDAIELTKEYSPHLLIMDINMPFINGLEAIKTIREINKDIIIIIISGYDKFEYAQKALEYGVSKYLLKPFSNDEFKEILLKSIDSVKINIRNSIPTPTDLNLEKSKDDILDYIKQNYHNPDLCLSHIEEKFNIGRTSIASYIKKETGKTFIDYLTYLKINKAKELLSSSDININKISELLGFNNQHYFSRVFKNHVGLSPLQYKNFE